MHYSFALLSTLLAFTIATPVPVSIDIRTSSLQKRGANWCTFHYQQSSTITKLTVYAPQTDANTAKQQLGFFSNSWANGGYTPLPGYGDTLVAVNNADQSVTFMGLGNIVLENASFKINKGDEGTVGACSVGAWNYGTTRDMDCGFTCVPTAGS